MAQIFSVETAKRLFREESLDLVLVAPSIIEAASEAFEREGCPTAATDIITRYEEMQAEFSC